MTAGPGWKSLLRAESELKHAPARGGIAVLGLRTNMIAKTLRLLGVLTAALTSLTLVAPGCGKGASTNGDSDLDGSVEGGDEAVTILGADSAPLKGCSGYAGQSPSSLPGDDCCTYGPSHCAPRSAIPPSL